MNRHIFRLEKAALAKSMRGKHEQAAIIWRWLSILCKNPHWDTHPLAKKKVNEY